MSSIERKFFRHMINATPKANAPTYETLGDDLEELNVEMNLNVEKKQNILGVNSIKPDKYEPEADVDPFYADAGSKFFEFLQDIIDNRRVLDDLKTDVLEIHLWEETTENSGVFEAYKEEVYVEPVSNGGDTTGYQLPFNIHYTGKRTKGTFDISNNTFTAA